MSSAPGLFEESAVTLLRMTGGFILHQCLHAAAELGVADALKNGTTSVRDLASSIGVDEEALYRVLRLLSGQHVFEETASRTFANTRLSECLRTDVPGSLRPFLIMRGAPNTVAALGDLLFSITTGKPSFEKLRASQMFSYLNNSQSEALLFDNAMTALTAVWARRIATAYEFSQWGSLMDIGGGNGLLLAEILRVHRNLQGVLAEQPDVLKRASERDHFPGELSRRVRFEVCDFFEGIPSGCRAYLMKMIIHDWNDGRARQILMNCRKSIAREGVLLLLEYQLGERNKPSLGKSIDIFMLAMTGGKERTVDQHRDLLSGAGFALRRAISVSSELMMLEALPV